MSEAGGLTYASVCSGIEAASVAWGPLGWRPAFFAEIDPFACAMLSHRFPRVPNLGDFTKIEGWAGPIDILVGGTPCQSFSVAGLRGGLDDPRGNLALEFLRLADKLRPTWLVWENVPGVLSSNGGKDFGSFLGGLAELGYGWAYRVLDAQHFGVPQRRRRVFVVAHSRGLWQRAAAVLFERHCLSGHPPEGREAGTDIANSLKASAGRNGGNCGDERGTIIARPLTASPHGYRSDLETETLIAHSLRADGFDASEDGTGRGTPLVPVAYQCHGGNVGPIGTLKGDGSLGGGVPFIVNAAESCATQSHARLSEVARCLDGTGSFANAQGGTVVAQPRTFNWQTGGDGRLGYGEKPTALQAQQIPALHSISGVRRLTPRECERLQGFPDDFTLVPYRGKPAADGPRYKALGNSFAVPVVRWIGRRLMDSITVPA